MRSGTGEEHGVDKPGGGQRGVFRCTMFSTSTSRQSHESSVCAIESAAPIAPTNQTTAFRYAWTLRVISVSLSTFTPRASSPFARCVFASSIFALRENRARSIFWPSAASPAARCSFALSIFSLSGSG